MIGIDRPPPLDVRLSVTDRCQLRCRYCMPAEGVPLCTRESILSFEEMTACIARLQTTFDIRKVRLTGGDPLARLEVVKLVAMLSTLGIPDLAMTTNAQELGERAAELAAAGLHRVNVSLDALNPETFRRITRGGDVHRTIAGIEAACRAGLHPVKLNMVVMRGINDHEVGDLLSFALAHGCELRYLELMPIGPGADLADGLFVPSSAVRQDLSARFTLEPIARAAGASSRRYRVTQSDGTEGIVGFISPCSDAFCADCKRLRITAEGRLMGCLARPAGAAIRPLLRKGNGDALSGAVRQALQCKRADRHFEQSTPMAAIGG